MVAKNDITGDKIQSKRNSEAYANNFDKIFNKKKAEFTEHEQMNMEVLQDMIENPRKTIINEYPDNTKDIG